MINTRTNIVDSAKFLQEYKTYNSGQIKEISRYVQKCIFSDKSINNPRKTLSNEAFKIRWNHAIKIHRVLFNLYKEDPINKIKAKVKPKPAPIVEERCKYSLSSIEPYISNRGYKVYGILNTYTGKWYIGKTAATIKERFRQHKAVSYKSDTEFYNDLSLNPEYFRIKLLFSTDNEKEAFEVEKEFIERYKTIERGYNIVKGGNGKSVNADKEELERLKRRLDNNYE